MTLVIILRHFPDIVEKILIEVSATPRWGLSVRFSGPPNHECSFLAGFRAVAEVDFGTLPAVTAEGAPV